MTADHRWRPQAGVKEARRRAAMLTAARDYFSSAEVLEIDAPALSRCAVSDPHIESLAVEPALIPGPPRYLHSSPEFAMKRMLADGFPDIYYIGKVFRDGEAGPRHQPEFTMIEWYRLGFDLQQIIDDCIALIAALLDGQAPRGQPQQVSYREAFQDALGIDPHVVEVAVLAEAAGADGSLRSALGDDRDAWLDLLLSTRVAPQFPGDRLTALYHYPASQAALAQLDPADQELAQRFEVFLGAVELANGYVELTDADEQRRRMLRDLEQRRLADKPVHEPDSRLLAALESGLPECAGVAVGFDRLLMLALNTDDIRDTRTFSWESA